MSTTRDFSRVITRPRVILVALIVMSWAILSFSKTEYYSVEKGSASPLVSALTVHGVPTDAPSGKPTSSSPGFFIVDVPVFAQTKECDKFFCQLRFLVDLHTLAQSGP